MAAAVEQAAAEGEHLLVQAGTGTGKSLAYLVPAIAHAVATNHPAVVSTATLALQAQIVDRDLPRIADALAPLLGRRPTWQLVKGRRNYVCRQKLVAASPTTTTCCSTCAATPLPRRSPRPPPSAPAGSAGSGARWHACRSGPRRRPPATATSWSPA